MFRLDCYTEGTITDTKHVEFGLLSTMKTARKLITSGTYTAVDVYDDSGNWLKEYMAVNLR